jgi:phage terminase small subunit
VSEVKVVQAALDELQEARPAEGILPSGAGKGTGKGPSAFIWWSQDGKHKVTVRQKLFCDAYLAGGLVNPKAAYKQAGYAINPNPAYLATSVSTLLAKPQIRAYIEENRPKFEAKLLITRDYVVEKLKDIAEESKNDNARVAALKHLGQFLGMWVERTEVTGKDGGPVGFADQTVDLSGVPEENLRRVKELLSAQKLSDDGEREVN